MKITEATFDISTIDKNDIGLLTLDEYLKRQNMADKYHPDDSYDFDLQKLNRSYYNHSRIWNGNETFDYYYNDRGGKIVKDNKVYGIVMNGNLYIKKHNKYFLKPKFWDHTSEENIELNGPIYVKYYDELLAKLDDISGENIKENPIVIKRFIDNGENFTIRSEKSPSKNNGATIVIMNEQNQIVASAQDEWGATLLTVAKEYRGRNFGTILGKVWYAINPDYRSGGYTPSGKSNAIKIWKDRARELFAAGVYSELIRTGIITKENALSIVKSIGKKSTKPTVNIDKTVEPLLFLDDGQFIIYDKKIFNDLDEKYIYAFGFVRDLPNGDLYPYRIDWEPSFRKLAILSLLSIEDEPLVITGPAPDFLGDLLDIPEIKLKDGYISIGEKTKNKIKEIAQYEKIYREKIDQYDEFKYQIIEIANSKWE